MGAFNSTSASTSVPKDISLPAMVVPAASGLDIQGIFPPKGCSMMATTKEKSPLHPGEDDLQKQIAQVGEILTAVQDTVPGWGGEHTGKLVTVVIGKGSVPWTPEQLTQFDAVVDVAGTSALAPAAIPRGPTPPHPTFFEQIAAEEVKHAGALMPTRPASDCSEKPRAMTTTITSPGPIAPAAALRPHTRVSPTAWSEDWDQTAAGAEEEEAITTVRRPSAVPKQTVRGKEAKRARASQLLGVLAQEPPISYAAVAKGARDVNTIISPKPVKTSAQGQEATLKRRWRADSDGTIAEPPIDLAEGELTRDHPRQTLPRPESKAEVVVVHQKKPPTPVFKRQRSRLSVSDEWDLSDNDGSSSSPRLAAEMKRRVEAAEPPRRAPAQAPSKKPAPGVTSMHPKSEPASLHRSESEKRRSDDRDEGSAGGLRELKPATYPSTAERIEWSAQEVAALRAGVDAFGSGRWVKILAQFKHRFHPKRSAESLKDKWRTLNKKVLAQKRAA